MHVVFGAYDGPIDAKTGEKVVFIGDCAAWKGQLGDQLVQVRSTYKPRDTLDPYTARHDDIIKKMAVVTGKLTLAEGARYVRLAGCPVSVAEQALALVHLAELNNPYTDPAHAATFQAGYMKWRAQTLFDRLKGHKYQQPGACSRGQAAPELSVGETKG